MNYQTRESSEGPANQPLHRAAPAAGEGQQRYAAVMMPFALEFAAVLRAIEKACVKHDLRCLRVDNVWEEATTVVKDFLESEEDDDILF